MSSLKPRTTKKADRIDLADVGRSVLRPYSCMCRTLRRSGEFGPL